MQWQSKKKVTFSVLLLAAREVTRRRAESLLHQTDVGMFPLTAAVGPLLLVVAAA